MIRRYVIGKVIETDAVLNKPTAEEGAFPFFKVDEEAMSFTYTMADEDIVYGLGQNVRGINKRGWIYESKCSDNMNHHEDTTALYASHNFLIVKGKEELFGLFLDYPGIITFDVGYSKYYEMKITASDWNMDAYVITGENLKDIVKQFRQLVGRSYIAPRWGLGYGQCKWSYMSAAEVREVAMKHRELGIPLDSMYLDIDYMERYKDFTINEETFPNFEEFVEEMKKENIHLVPIIDAGVKMEEGYSVYEEGMEKGYFCLKEDGKPFLPAVWPGLSVFPDVLNKEAREWFGNNYKFLLDKGIEGFWNDMNEPTIFYTDETVADAIDEIASYKGKNMALDSFWYFKDIVNNLQNNVENYKKFYHVIDGEKVRHDRVHNLFGYNMTRAAGEAFERLEPEKRILMFSRSSYIGMHRYGGIWQGDNKAWWSHLLMNIKMTASLNMCGFIYTGADLGGFGTNTTEDLVMRWLEFGIYTPLMRNHVAMGQRDHEVYRFENIDGFRHVVSMRYRLLPYIYSEYMKAVLRDEMMIRPLSFDFENDPMAAQVEDQLLVGDGMMIAPVYTQNATGRYVYLPERMMKVCFSQDGSQTEEILEKGHHYIHVGLSDVVFFVRPNHIIPMSTGGQHVDEVDFDNTINLAFVEDVAEYEYYNDDGYQKDYDNPALIKVIRIEK